MILDGTDALATRLAAYAWQVSLHSAVCGLIVYGWTRRVPMPSGGAKRHLLTMLLVVPLLTAAAPGRAAVEFGERQAVLNSARLLAIPLGGPFEVWHVAALLGLVTVVITLWQEIWPVFERPAGSAATPPASLIAKVRAKPGWARCRVELSDAPGIVVATGGWPGRMRLVVSNAALASLDDAQLDVTLAHEHAHWAHGRWWRAHALFVARLLQGYNPVAMWAFREYCIEVEVACDAAAVAGCGPRTLIRVLLKVYEATSPRDVAAKAAVRKRVDVLMSGGPEDAPVPALTLHAVAALMLLVLPWIA